MYLRFNIRHLRVFREVARTKKASIAAAHEHLTQSAVTQAIAGLEGQLGIKLFERRRDGMYLTEPGADFLSRVKYALAHLRTGAQDAVRLGQRQGNRGFPEFDRLLTVAQLRALVAIADARNFSLAARRMGISQPSLHRAARNLEQLAGLALFKSAPEGTSLSPAAQELARRARLAFAELQQGVDQIRAHLGKDTARIVVGSLPLARTSVLPVATANLLAERSGVRVQVLDGPYEQLLGKLRQGDIDFIVGALRFPTPTNDITQESLFEDPLALVAGRNHPLHKVASPTLADTLGYPWIAPPETTPGGAYLTELLRRAGASASPVCAVSSSLVFLRGMLTSGPFISIISRHQAKYEIESGDLVPLAIDLPHSHRSIGLTYRADWQPTATQQRYLDLIRQAAVLEHGA